ncbi:MAG TPA: hypothetical protein VHS52_08780, partial [Acidimicrobiales bacterium]|nr:hypothetical protein [Acidimicrobiales bacterium]
MLELHYGDKGAGPVRTSGRTAILTAVLVVAAGTVAPAFSGTAASAGTAALASTAVPPSFTVAVDGALDQVVVDRSGHAFATNPARNEVEVLSVATGKLDAPIVVGSSPAGLDLSPDEATLYVADAQSNDISVVDVAQRRQVRRIALPPAPNGGQPLSIAVAANGTALVTRTASGGTSEGVPTLSIDLANGTVRERRDWDYTSSAGDRSVVKASGDRSRIAIVREPGPGQPGVAAFY